MTFEEALKQEDYDELRAFAKSDLHSHAGRSGNATYIGELINRKIDLPPTKFNSLDHMQEWYVANIRGHIKGAEGQIMLWKAGFEQARRDTITKLTLSFSTSDIELVGGMEQFMNILNKFNKELTPNTLFLPELTYGRACDVCEEESKMDEILSYGFFKSIDVCCDEFAQPIRNFKGMYRKAKEHGLLLRAHVGEFGSADDVMEAVEELQLDEIHHGIAAAQSEFITRWLAKNKVRLHICPSSNVMLNVVDEYSNHPIKKLYREGVPVSINTDDLLIFNQSVSQEYMNLYRHGVLTAEELNQIRLDNIR